jgi:hypothetical protein
MTEHPRAKVLPISPFTLTSRMRRRGEVKRRIFLAMLTF